MIGLISFVGFTALVAFISYYATRKTDEASSDGYFLGGRSLTAGVIAGSLLLTNLSTEQLVGLNGSAYSEGILVMAWETLAAIAMVATALYLLPRYLKGGLTTIPQFLSERFDVTTKTLTSALFLTGYVVVLLPTILYSGSLAISAMFDVPELLGVSEKVALWVCIWGIGVVGSIYAVFGGLKAVAVSDSINAIGLLVGGILIPIFGLMIVGDGNVFDGITTLQTDIPEKFNSIGTKTASVPFVTIFTGMMLVQLFYWGTNQQIIQRALGAKNLQEGQKGLLLASFIKILGPLIVVLPGIIAYYMAQQGILDVSQPDQAYGELVKKVLPPEFIGFFAAVLFGAILSSFNSVLNSSVTLFGIDIYKEHINKEADEKTTVKYGKIFGIILAIGAMLIAPFLSDLDSIFSYLQQVNGIYSIPILTIIFVGFVTKKVPAIAAKIGLLSGSILYIISEFVIRPNKVSNALTTAEANGITSAEALKVIEADAYPHFLHVMAILFLLNVAIMLIIGYFKPRTIAYKQKFTNEVDITPWKHAKFVGLIIVIIVVLVYLYYS
ncbi:solute:sodium symporter family transporter [Flavobacteriaceae bacterium S0825]|uniref:solute:sodium symporter family transporter n=1 Tax=Gaetbulibacter sp. S0825 TaxID=2720084 RepID=UPI0014302EAF|nr:solute:sodium symporter family transporter [Gaetbulibacter sp. S0825]MCK0108883.1 solute:sodium symporter family transporter [Flavobacteriaceae bacterium S0825]NIX64519.1 solute:sodium symporter family transporter [Gaetbulibacter sp. S0825]